MKKVLDRLKQAEAHLRAIEDYFLENFDGYRTNEECLESVFITTSSFNSNATEYAHGLHQKVILIDGRRLSELMIEYGVGVSEERAYRIKKIDSDYFEEA
jgi:restriction system protein